jgi:predicted nucleic acid-binding protein
MIAFDSNVFIYILDENPEFFEKAQTALRQVTKEAAVISTLVYTECLAKPTGQAFDKSKQLLDALCQRYKITVLPIDTEVAILAAQLRSRYCALRTPDALHIASALRGGATKLVTNDLSLTKLSVNKLSITGL